MKRTCLTSILLAVLLTACRSTGVTYVDDPKFSAKVGEAAFDRKVKLVLRTGETFWARALRVERDTVSFLDVTGQGEDVQNIPVVRRCPFESVSKIVRVSRWDGAAYVAKNGALIGAASGLVVGLLLGAAINDEFNDWGRDNNEAWVGLLAFEGALGGAFYGAVIGGVLGAVGGRHHVYDFQEASPVERRYVGNDRSFTEPADLASIQHYEIGSQIELKNGVRFDLTNPLFLADSVYFLATRERTPHGPVQGWRTHRNAVRRAVAVSDIKRGLKDRVYRIELYNGNVLFDVTGLTLRGDSLFFRVARERLSIGMATHDQPIAKTLHVSGVKRLSYRLEAHREE